MASSPVPGKENSPLKIPEKSPSIKTRNPRDFQMRDADLGEQNNEAIDKWVCEQIRVRKEQYQRLHRNLVPRWRQIAAGKPKEENKSFPWPNAANLVHQLVGQEIDNLTARVLGLVYARSPLQYFRNLAKTNNPFKAAQKSKLLEDFYDCVGYEPEELDLYRIDSVWLTDSARLGTAWVKCAIEDRVESVVVGYDEKAKKTMGEDQTLYKGPRVFNLAFEDVLNDPYADTPEASCIWIHIRSLTRKELEERSFKKFFWPDAVESIKGRPDRTGPREVKKREATKKGVQQPESQILSEWDVYECWFRWFHNGRTYRMIEWVHYESKVVLRRVFNFMPDNELPCVRTKLNSGDTGMNGTGYAEMLESYQEEISTTKNQRIDATTMGILGVNRISPQNKNIDKYFQVYPGAAAPFGKDEFEHISVGNPSMVQASVENEQLMIQQAHDRAGVAPAVAGSGMGKWDKKGNYGSMGTLAVMTDSNTVTNYRQSDFRHARVKLASKLMKMYAGFGMGRQGTYFGMDEELLQEALDDFLQKKIRIPIRAATASSNREVDKQNSILLSQQLMAYHQNSIKLLQAIDTNAAMPPDAKKYFVDVLKSEATMEKRLLRDFGFDQPDEFVPETVHEQAQQEAPAAQPPMAYPQPAPGQGPAFGGQPGMAPAGAGTTQLQDLLAGAARPGRTNGGSQGNNG